MTSDNDPNTTKVVLVIRRDLGLTPGKIAAQTAHACLRLPRGPATGTIAFAAEGQAVVGQTAAFFQSPPPPDKAVAVWGNDATHFSHLAKRCEELGIPHHVFKDGGITEVVPGTATVMAIGPGPEPLINKVAGDLPLVRGPPQFMHPQIEVPATPVRHPTCPNWALGRDFMPGPHGDGCRCTR